ncbi:MAG TPA: GPR endopeptidase [Tenericutes bacterium]|nr:GPR endopeptidase [Mycoplasmatota bacterium]
MSHEIDLSKYEIRTDLAIESIEENENIEGIKSVVEKVGDIKITNVVVDKKGSSVINKKIGMYITIEFDDVTDKDNKEKVIEVFSFYFNRMLRELNLTDNKSCMIIGLGNSSSTPDALGPLVVEDIVVTKHLFELGCVGKGFRNVCAINPGVMGKTGIETSNMVKSIVESEKPDFLIVVDALASKSLDRVNKTIQMSDAGINPGSGIGNNRKEISKEVLGIPVIAIGVPTVVDAVTIVSDTINFMHKHYSYMKKNINNPVNRLIPLSSINYLKEKIEIEENDKTKLLGYIGSLNDKEIRALIYEVLSPIGYNMIVTPKEVDFVMKKLSEIISKGINKTLHESMNNT